MADAGASRRQAGVGLRLREIDRKNEGRVKPLKKPAYATFLRFIKASVSPYDKVLHREGPKAAAQKFRNVHRADLPLMPLDVVEIDHTPLDILLVDEDGAEVGQDGRGRRRIAYYG